MRSTLHTLSGTLTCWAALVLGSVFVAQAAETDGDALKRDASARRETNTSASPKVIDIATGRKHWAFQPVGHPQPPELAQNSWGGQDVDRFIFARLEQAGLHPSAPADRRTLIRRSTFDLLGLPPTQEEVDAFVRDASPNAFQKVVDRLLASPHFGEQWARHWLDVARYSDTKGYVYAREESQFVHAWPYRDWVVRSMNEDLPYDRFLLLQLAADQVVPSGSPHLAAMGFLTLGRRFLGVMPDIIDDRIDVVMRTTQGLSVACARCHDHKFDPIPTRDYYALYGVFRSCAEQLVLCASASMDEAFNKELRVREQKLHDIFTLRREEQSARVRATVTDHLLAQLELEKYPGETFSQLLGVNDINPVFVRRWQRYLAEAQQRHDPIFSAWHEFMRLRPTDFASHAVSATPGLHPLVAQAFATPPTTLREVAERYGALFATVEKQWQDLLKSEPAAKALPDSQAESLRRVLYGPDSPCSVPEEHLANNEWFFPTDITTELWKLQGEVDRWLIQSAEAPAHATLLVDRTTPTAPRVFKRGNPLTEGEEVPRQFLQVLAQNEARPFTQGSGRLEFAQAIISADNPLTARVMVNRVWMLHFGRGLIPTPSDFGKRAGLPSHPELLDWLARRFMDEGWSVKSLHRRILLSATYQQSSLAPESGSAALQSQEVDAENRLLWRMNTHRLSFEEMRDAWLASTGELETRLGGKATELFAAQNARRTLYAKVDREGLPSVMRTFDFANPDLCIPQRTDTIVPQQALFGLNHPFLAARAKELVRRSQRGGIAGAERVRRLYHFLFQREPSTAELDAAIAFVQPDASGPRPRGEKPNPWRYGYGEFDEGAGRVKTFTPLPHFSGTAWQGGERFPDEKLGWAQLTATGGHPGNDRRHAVTRRWVVPEDGRYAITSTLIHQPAEGDGIRAFISHSREGLLRSIALHTSTAELNIEDLSMRAGETLDFTVDIRDGLNSDQFLWSPRIAAVGKEDSGGENDAQKDFAGPASETLTLWEQLAQTLMLTNEFVFVD